MGERERRIAENEVLFREVNERIDELTDRLGLAGQTMQVVCECGDESCLDRIELTTDAYAEVRRHPRRFVAVPGHEDPSVESVVEERDGYNVIEKRPGEQAEPALRTAPR